MLVSIIYFKDGDDSLENIIGDGYISLTIVAVSKAMLTHCGSHTCEKECYGYNH